MGSSGLGADADAEVDERARKLSRREAVTRDEEVQGRRWRIFEEEKQRKETNSKATEVKSWC